MSNDKPKILTIRLGEIEDGVSVTFEHGVTSIVQKVRKDVGIQKINVIFNREGKLTDAEIVAE